MLDTLVRKLGGRVRTDRESLEAYGRDSSRAPSEGLPRAVVLAQSAYDVSIALAWAQAHSVSASVRGAGTGLVGGANSYAGGLVISLEQMNSILEIDVENRLARVEAGVITAELDRAAREHGLFFAPDPASAAISTVGGNIATNAGGLRCIAHGVTGDSVAALEVVLADGRLLQTGGNTRKNVVGYDLTRLFVGSEGTLGVITSATVRLHPVPEGTPSTFMASFSALEDAGRAVTSIMQTTSRPEILELMDAFSVGVIDSYSPLDMTPPAGALLVGQTVGKDATEVANTIAALCVAAGAEHTEVSDSNALLEARRLANPALVARGLRYSCDVGVPVSQLATMFRGVEAIAARHETQISVFAHAGDGNLHCATTGGDSADSIAAAERVLDDVSRLALQLGGTLSGEHGIGSTKHHELSWQLSQTSLDVHHAIKAALDPRGILTPGRAI